MLPDYKDITSRIQEKPIWYTLEGVPRYEPFKHEMLGIYDEITIYYKIACQACQEEFLVAEGHNLTGFLTKQWTNIGLKIAAGKSLEEAKAELTLHEYTRLDWAKELVNHLHYGDPPRHGGCVGETMNCDDLEILEVWIKNPTLNWKRHKELEGEIDGTLDET